MKILILLSLFLLSSHPLLSQGPQWITYNTGNSDLPSDNVHSLAVDQNNNIWVGTDSGLAQFKNNKWILYNTSNSAIPSNNISGVSIDDFNNVWISTIDSGAAVFDHASWIIYKTSNSGIQYNNLGCVYIDAFNSKWFGTGGVSKYDGLSWLNFNTLNSNIPNSAVLAITSRSNELWISTYHKGIARLIDTTWTVYNQTNSPLPNDYTNVIYKDFENNIWVGMETEGIAKITENYSWQIINKNNSGLPGNWVLEILITPQVKWFGTGAWGLAQQKDTTWTVFNVQNSPLQSNTILSLARDSSGNLWIGTFGGLAVYNEGGIVHVNNTILTIPKEFRLHQNFPNPYNSETKILFTLKDNTEISLTIYDISGRLVSKLLQGRLQPGNHSIIFKSENLPSGVYFYTLKSSEYSETKKMVLVK